MRIALLEDDPDQGRLLQGWLGNAGHACEHYDASRPFMRAVKRESYDILILDWLVPEVSGIEVLEWVRANLDWHIPVIFVTSMDREEDIVTALEGGADDYLSKPVRERELLARIGALARRASPAGESRAAVELGPYRIDPQTRSVAHAGERIDLTQREYELALFLFRNPERVLSRGHILESVWGKSGAINTRTVDTHVSRLRSKLGLGGEDSEWRLNAIYQHGYRLERTHE